MRGNASRRRRQLLRHPELLFPDPPPTPSSAPSSATSQHKVPAVLWGRRLGDGRRIIRVTEQAFGHVRQRFGLPAGGEMDWLAHQWATREHVRTQDLAREWTCRDCRMILEKGFMDNLTLLAVTWR